MRLKPESPDQCANRSNKALDDAVSIAMIEPKGKRRPGMRWWLVAGAIAMLGIGGGLAYLRFKPMPTPVTVSLLPVKRGTVELTISESGVVELGNQQVLKSPEDVTVERVFVQVGDRVKVGAPLIILRNREDQKQQQAQIVDNQKALVDLTR